MKTVPAVAAAPPLVDPVPYRVPALAAVPDPVPGPAAEMLGTLPADWVCLEGVRSGEHLIDLVVLGPNGIFAVHLDPDLRPAAVRPGVGLVRAGARRPEPVKQALYGAAALRAALAGLPGDPFPYPVLVTAAPGGVGHRLGRLLVVRPGRFAAAVWSHLSRPLRRSERTAVRRALGC